MRLGTLAKEAVCQAVVAILMVSCTPTQPAGSTLSPTTPSQTDAGADILWLRQHTIPFEAVQPGGSIADLLPLKQMIGNARIVALGEATHGTHEFFELKHRMLEFMVKEMGFRIFALEANWPEANMLNAYVHTGKGDAAELLKGLHFWTWNTQEVLDIIEWMRAYNANASDSEKISFYGFDMQFDQAARNNVAEYMRQVDPVAADQIADYYACYPQDSAACQDRLQATFDWLNQHEVEYTARSSPNAFAEALHSARIVLQYRDYASHDGDIYLRDRYMAENVEWLLEQAGPDARLVLWAHNGHVGTTGEQAPLSMGDHLRRGFGSQMVVFGLLFGEGSFNAYGATRIQTFQVDRPPVNAYESYFEGAGLPQFFLDLRQVKPASPAADWLLTPHPFRSIGSAYNPADARLGFQTAALASMFDVVIYFRHTSPSLLLGK